MELLRLLGMLGTGIVGFSLIIAVIIFLCFLISGFPKIEIEIPNYIKDILAFIITLTLILALISLLGGAIYQFLGWQLPEFLIGVL